MPEEELDPAFVQAELLVQKNKDGVEVLADTTVESTAPQNEGFSPNLPPIKVKYAKDIRPLFESVEGGIKLRKEPPSDAEIAEFLSYLEAFGIQGFTGNSIREIFARSGGRLIKNFLGYEKGDLSKYQFNDNHGGPGGPPLIFKNLTFAVLRNPEVEGFEMSTNFSKEEALNGSLSLKVAGGGLSGKSEYRYKYYQEASFANQSIELYLTIGLEPTVWEHWCKPAFITYEIVQHSEFLKDAVADNDYKKASGYDTFTSENGSIKAFNTDLKKIPEKRGFSIEKEKSIKASFNLSGSSDFASASLDIECEIKVLQSLNIEYLLPINHAYNFDRDEPPVEITWVGKASEQ